MAEKISSSEVTQLLETQKKDGFSQAELNIIKQKLQGLDETGLDQVKSYIQAHIQDDAKTQLLDLANEYSVLGNLPYTLDSFKSPDTEALNMAMMTFSTHLEMNTPENFREMYSKLGSEEKNSLQIVLWKNFVSHISLSEVVKSKIEGFTSKIQSISQSIGEVLNKGGKKEEILSVFGNETPGKTGGVSELINQFLQTNYQGALKLEASTIAPEEKAKIFKNPSILESVLNTGKYTGPEGSVDIEKNTSALQTGDTTKDQAEFMKEAALLHKQKGESLQSKIDAVKTGVQKLGGLAEKLGLTEANLESMKEKLFGLPIIGAFLKMFLGNDFFDSIREGMGNQELSTEHKKSASSLQSLLTNKDKKINFGGDDLAIELTQKAPAKPLRSFLEKVEALNAGEQTTPKKAPLHTTPDFWEIILSKKEAANPELNDLKTQIQSQLQKEFGDTKKISQKDLYRALSKVELKKYEAPAPVATVTQDQTPAPAQAQAQAQTQASAQAQPEQHSASVATETQTPQTVNNQSTQTEVKAEIPVAAQTPESTTNQTGIQTQESKTAQAEGNPEIANTTLEVAQTKTTQETK